MVTPLYIGYMPLNSEKDDSIKQDGGYVCTYKNLSEWALKYFIGT